MTEQPATGLTRKQIRELRNTGSTPIVAQDAAAPAAEKPIAPIAPTPAPAAYEPARVETLVAPYAPAAPVLPVAPLARAVEPPVLPPPPIADAAVDLGVSPLTRRQARQQERIRTASVPVITPEIAAAYTQSAAGAPAPAPNPAPVSAPLPSTPSWLQPAPVPVAQAPVVEAPAIEVPVETSPAPTLESLFGVPATDEPAPVFARSAPPAEKPAPVYAPPPAAAPAAPAAPAAQPVEERAAVNPALGAGLTTGVVAAAALPPSFDELIVSTSGSTSSPNTLIVDQKEAESIVAPVVATGQMLVTGTLNLPEGLGSTGVIPGKADGKEVDAVLVDGELPASSSPTPIAASSAISTVKTPGEIIKPPVPEKGSRLMMSLAITAGVLALALVGVLILAFVTGVF